MRLKSVRTSLSSVSRLKIVTASLWSSLKSVKTSIKSVRNRIKLSLNSPMASFKFVNMSYAKSLKDKPQVCQGKCQVIQKPRVCCDKSKVCRNKS